MRIGARSTGPLAPPRGFGAGNPDTETSLGAVTELGALAEGAGAATVLYM